MKLLWLLPILAGAVLLGRRCRWGAGRLCGEIFERMPDDFPPRQMHRNILAIREQTDRILRLMEEHSSVDAEA